MCIIAQLFGCEAKKQVNRLIGELNSARMETARMEQVVASYSEDIKTLNDEVNLWQQRFSDVTRTPHPGEG